MSQVSSLGRSFNLMLKNWSILLIFSPQTKTKTYIKDLRHMSLHMVVLYIYM